MPEAAKRRTSVENVQDALEALAQRFFVVEYLELNDDGPALHRVALRNWPEWADAINPGRTAPAEQAADEVLRNVVRAIKSLARFKQPLDLPADCHI